MKTKIQNLVNVAKKHQRAFVSTAKGFAKIAKLQLKDLHQEINDVVFETKTSTTDSIQNKQKSGPFLSPKEYAKFSAEYEKLSATERNDYIQKIIDYHKEKKGNEELKEQDVKPPRPKSIIRQNGEVLLVDSIEDIKLALPQIKLMPMKRSMLAWEHIAKKVFPELSPGIKKHVDKIMNYDDVYVEVTPEDYWESKEWAEVKHKTGLDKIYADATASKKC